jgi:hypothetical protein
VEDLYRFEQALHTEKLLKKTTLDSMFTPFQGDYGYGWKVGRQFNRRVISHDGIFDGFRTSIVRFPDDRACVIVLSNIENARLNEITRFLAAIVLGEPYDLEDLPSPVTRPKVGNTVQVDPNLYDAYAGRYDLPMGVFTVTREGDKLMGHAAGEPSKAELVPLSPTRFAIPGPGEVEVTFVSGEGGRVTHMNLSFQGRQFQGRKID